MSDRMRALRLDRNGGADAIRFDADVAIPRPGIGDVLLRVDAASLTPTELGWPSTWVDHAGVARTPVTPCHEVCGVVTALGYGTTGFAVGDSAFGITDWYRDGAAAEYVAVEARNLAPKPAGCTAVDAAALALPGLTAMQAMFGLGALTKGETVVISGAAGGVGLIAIQLARNAGARVVAVARRDSEQVVRDLGADDFVDVDLLDGVDLQHVDVVFELVGGEVRDRLLRAAPTARAVSVVEPHEGLQFFVVEAHRPTLEDLARLAEAGDVQAMVGEVVPLADGAHAFADRPHPPGKRVIEVRTAEV
jgi:NADPH:quinone reductase-like Zn-dependent oxidoreductase